MDVDLPPAQTVPIESVVVGDTLRLSEPNREHLETLAQATGELPPIVVDRRTMRVIDGVHRLLAARFRGDGEIAVRLFDGDAAAAFVLALKLNVRHGLPLTLAERSSAAARLLALHPDWSDRSIARLTGLAPATIGQIRRSTVHGEQSRARVGGDGRVRPLNAAEGRRRASELLRLDPGAGLREISRRAGISAATARDVRRRLARGQDPVPAGLRAAERPGEDEGRRRPSAAGLRRRRAERDPKTILGMLQKDPSLRLTDSGRMILKSLAGHVVSVDRLIGQSQRLPSHSMVMVAELARAMARNWEAIADDLERRARNSGAS